MAAWPGDSSWSDCCTRCCTAANGYESHRNVGATCSSCDFVRERTMAGAGMGGVEQGSSADARARDTEEQMTDEERFSLLVSVMGVNDVVTVRDKRIPEGVPMSAGYVPGVARLGIPALLMSDASLGVTNP